VGVRTVQVAGLTTEVFYPAKRGSEAGKSKVRYDPRLFLPESERKKIRDEKNPWQDCDCYRDLELDGERGPYPVVLFIHGMAGFRTQSLAHLTHWASRGFVVASADHPLIMLRDLLQLKFNPHQDKEAVKLLGALRAPGGALSFLTGHVDGERMAVVGHSAGGRALAGLGDESGVQVLIPLASRGTDAHKSAVSTLVMGGLEDETLPYPNQQEGYEKSAKPRRLVGLSKAGHLAFTEMCALGEKEGGLFQIAVDAGVTVPSMFQDALKVMASDGCKKGQLDARRGWEIVHYATSAALEEVLHCSSSASQKLSKIKEVYPEVNEYREEK